MAKDEYNYTKKFLYLDKDDEFQAECIALLKLIGHKQGKLLGLMAHEFIEKYGIDIDKFNKQSFAKLYEFLDIQARYDIKSDIRPIIAAPMYAQACKEISQKEQSLKKTKANKIKEMEMSEEDVEQMNDALSVFGI